MTSPPLALFRKIHPIWEPDPSLLHIFVVKMFLLTGEKMGHSPSFPSTCHCLRQFAHPADFIIPATLKTWRKKIVVKFPKDFWNNQEYLLPLSPMIWNLQILLFILGTLNQFDPLNHKIMIILHLEIPMWVLYWFCNETFCNLSSTAQESF